MDETTIIFMAYIIGIGLNIMIASAKKRSMGGVFFTSLLFSPLIPYLYLLAVPVKKIEENQKPEEK